jgi:hypothetical protein
MSGSIRFAEIMICRGVFTRVAEELGHIGTLKLNIRTASTQLALFTIIQQIFVAIILLIWTFFPKIDTFTPSKLKETI